MWLLLGAVLFIIWFVRFLIRDSQWVDENGDSMTKEQVRMRDEIRRFDYIYH